MDPSKNGRDPRTADGQFPRPPAGFDALEASPEQLRHFGLPPRPDKDTKPEQFALFKELFGPPVSYLDSAVVLSQLVIGTNVLPAVQNVTPRTRWDHSPNWCGASLDANRDKTFVFIVSGWEVLAPEIPDSSVLPPQGERRTYHCSTWVGLDGQRRYVDSSLPQVGTSQAVSLHHDGSTERQIQAWSQWWVKDNPNDRQQVFKFFKIDVNDHVACALQVWGPSEAVVYAINFGNGGGGPKSMAWRAIEPPGPPITLPGGQLHTPTISGATAEWILERPTLPGTTTIEDLPKFADFTFEHCYAYEANPSTPGWPWIVGEGQRLESPTFIRLFDRPKDPPRTRFIAMPHRVVGSTTSVRISYGGFKP